MLDSILSMALKLFRNCSFCRQNIKIFQHICNVVIGVIIYNDITKFQFTCGLSIISHAIISLPDVMSNDKNEFQHWITVECRKTNAPAKYEPGHEISTMWYVRIHAV